MDHDPRFCGDVSALSRCNFIGVTTTNPDSQATKLYSPHLPFVHFDEDWMRLYRYAGYCGAGSGVKTIQENYLKQAINVAKDQNINCEPSGISGLAILFAMKDKIEPNKKILIVNTGKLK